MQQSSIAFTLFLASMYWAVPEAFAEPFAFQCQLPMRPAVIQTPVPLPTNGQFIIKFQRFTGESTVATIAFSSIRGDHKRFLERIAQEINNESSQRPPKMVAVRERGLDQTRVESVANITVVALDEIFRLLLVYDRSAMAVAFEGPSGYTLQCNTLAPVREVPDLTNVKIESQPKILFAAFPTRVRNNELAPGAIVFADREDDVNRIHINYRAEESSLAGGTLALALQEIPIPSPYGEGLKAIKFELKIGCIDSLTFDAIAIATDKLGNESEPFLFKFNCEA